MTRPAAPPQGDVRIIVYDHDYGDESGGGAGRGLMRRLRSGRTGAGSGWKCDGEDNGGLGDERRGSAGARGADAVCFYLWVHTGFVRTPVLRMQKVSGVSLSPSFSLPPSLPLAWSVRRSAVLCR